MFNTAIHLGIQLNAIFVFQTLSRLTRYFQMWLYKNCQVKQKLIDIFEILLAPLQRCGPQASFFNGGGIGSCVMATFVTNNRSQGPRAILFGFTDIIIPVFPRKLSGLEKTRIKTQTPAAVCTNEGNSSAIKPWGNGINYSACSNGKFEFYWGSCCCCSYLSMQRNVRPNL